jgi:hypothetical protein
MSEDSIRLGSADLESIFYVVVVNDLLCRLRDDEYILFERATVETDPPEWDAYLLKERTVFG